MTSVCETSNVIKPTKMIVRVANEKDLVTEIDDISKPVKINCNPILPIPNTI